MNFEETAIDRKPLRCSLCLDDYTRPRTLPVCAHSFCTPCIHSYVESYIDQAKSGLFPCPVCSHPFKGPADKTSIKEWSKALSLNYQLMALLQERNEKKLFPCEPCDSKCYDLCSAGVDAQPGTGCFHTRGSSESLDTYNKPPDIVSNAAYFCLQCFEAYCGNCSDVHRSSRASMSHVQIPTNDPCISEVIFSTIPESRCPYHHDKKIEFYCHSHKEFICSMCAIFKHKKCNSVAESSTFSRESCMDDLIEEVETLFNEVQTRLDSILKRIDEHHNEEIRKMRMFQQEVTTMRQVVNTKLDQYEKHCQDILQNLEKVSQETMVKSVNTVKGISAAIATDKHLFRAVAEQNANSDIGVFCQFKKEGLKKLMHTIRSKGVRLNRFKSDQKYSKEMVAILEDNTKGGAAKLWIDTVVVVDEPDGLVGTISGE